MSNLQSIEYYLLGDDNGCTESIHAICPFCGEDNIVDAVYGHCDYMIAQGDTYEVFCNCGKFNTFTAVEEHTWLPSGWCRVLVDILP